MNRALLVAVALPLAACAAQQSAAAPQTVIVHDTVTVTTEAAPTTTTTVPCPDYPAPGSSLIARCAEHEFLADFAVRDARSVGRDESVAVGKDYCAALIANSAAPDPFTAAQQAIAAKYPAISDTDRAGLAAGAVAWFCPQFFAAARR